MSTSTLSMPAANTANPALASQVAPPAQLTGVTHRYGSGAAAHVALDRFSLTVRPGEVLALLGPNGAGKTTAIKLLLGLLRPTEGTATVFGGSPLETRTRERLGAMLQVARVPETLTASEYLDLFRSYYPRPLPQDEVIRIAGLQEIAKKQFKDLSGGQKQRLLFALAICGDPDLVFLDEPTLGMDIETRHALWAQVRALSERGKSVLLTTHYLEEADTLAHRIAVIARGRVIAEGTPVDIKAQVSGRKVRCVTEVPEAQLRALPGVIDVEYIGSAVTLTVKQAEPVLRALLPLDSSLHSLEVTSPNLEDAFLALTQDK
ncbi:ABC transporter ATP-binding protein [Terriglobus aquaticus]|uniref:ABC transporter ATP-binding protein n=1 Tax=Terriglobus aquaticus TaxID=940139 RepID=A0ABW9KG25_9BACT|nr:ABC transporter ATP-binding protein [Terriglobus aquaticus]